jgi:trimeric autotransporter adhesin
MNKISILFILSFFAAKTYSQSVSINNTGATAHSSAMLDVASNTKGILIPRMTSVDRQAIVTPAKGLLVFDNDTNSFWFFDGAVWVNQQNYWSINGNAGTTASNFIGTTDIQPLRFSINGKSAGIIDSVKANTAIGYGTLRNITTGNFNTAHGYKALNKNTTGVTNTSIGYSALSLNTIGESNTASGANALFVNTDGNNNTANGAASLFNNSGGNNNSAFGYKSLLLNDVGNNNVAVGNEALLSNTSGFSNTSVGYQSLYSNDNGYGNASLGAQSLYKNIDGYFNTAIGAGSLYANTSGTRNVANGYYALGENTSGGNNIAIGVESAQSNTTGNSNTALGYQSLRGNTTASFNTAIGSGAMVFSSSTGDFNTAVGVSTLRSNGGEQNTASGFQALYSNGIGIFNTAIGVNSLQLNTNGNYNTALGHSALLSNNSGSRNIGIGNNCNLIAMTASDNFKARIGDATTNSIGGVVGWSTLSDGRTKKNIKAEVPGIVFINKLKPVTYNYDIEKEMKLFGIKIDDKNLDKSIEQIKFSGFIAQDVEAAAKSIDYDFSGVDKTSNGGYLLLRYAEFVVPLVKAVQEQQVIIETQNKNIETLQSDIAELKKLLKK